MLKNVNRRRVHYGVVARPRVSKRKEKKKEKKTSDTTMHVDLYIQDLKKVVISCKFINMKWQRAQEIFLLLNFRFDKYSFINLSRLISIAQTDVNILWFPFLIKMDIVSQQREPDWREQGTSLEKHVSGKQDYVYYGIIMVLRSLIKHTSNLFVQ